MMKIWLRVLALCLCVVLAGSALAEETALWYHNGNGYTNTYQSTQRAAALMRISTRSGPGTNYDELGSYHKKGYELTVLSKAWDEHNGIWWVQVELGYGSQLRRAYTGLKRVDVDIDTVQEDVALYNAVVAMETTPYYGPGSAYTRHKEAIPAGTTGMIYALEDGYALLELYDELNEEYRRVWLPVGCLIWSEYANG